MRTAGDDEPSGARGPAGGSGRGPNPGGPRRDDPRRPGLRPTRPITLILSGLLTTALSWLLMGRFFGSIPDVTWLAGLTLAGLAVVEGIAAHNTKARVEQRPRAGALNPLFIARLAVLAKASSLAGAIFAGVYGGVAIWALANRGVLTVANVNLAPAAGGVIGALALVAAALLLERACRVPEPPEDKGADTATGGPQPRP